MELIIIVFFSSSSVAAFVFVVVVVAGFRSPREKNAHLFKTNENNMDLTMLVFDQ